MPIGTPEVLERILDLFPADTLREFEQATEKKTKAEAISAVVAGYENEGVLGFIANNFGRLHQHVYVFPRSGAVRLADSFGAPFGVREDAGETHSHYLVELTHHLVVEPPLERIQVEFAWPIKVVEAPAHVRIHLTIMSRSPKSYVGDERTIVSAKQVPEERELVELFRLSPGVDGVAALDVNRGIKALWDADQFDAPSVQYKRARSTAKDVMDEDFTVKEHDPALYELLRDKPLFGTTFRFGHGDPCISYFYVQPTDGFFGFRRFASSNECVDDVIRSVLENN